MFKPIQKTFMLQIHNTIYQTGFGDIKEHQKKSALHIYWAPAVYKGDTLGTQWRPQVGSYSLSPLFCTG